MQNSIKEELQAFVVSDAELETVAGGVYTYSYGGVRVNDGYGVNHYLGDTRGYVTDSGYFYFGSYRFDSL
ncbi:MAG: hypothetical protein DSM106950_29755 [Stigonema ocellatum SAG 48.90 = DSM 106950]|nr:hypothetical protein [Stigonema ocellatum SAG 48.90 = DSM 106950]